jgi:putative tryptophan/tyrosine transport system substrate-binding protein
MRRREFITLLGGGAASWPIATFAQQAERKKRIAVLMAWSEDNPEYRSWVTTFLEGLAQSGWVDGRSVQIDVHWGEGDPERIQAFAKQIVEAQPDVIFASTTPVTAALQRETHTIPIVFVIVADPVGAGFVAGLSHPGGNITGFVNIEPATAGKWLVLLRDIVPQIRQVAMMYNPDTAPGGGRFFLGPFETAARSLAIDPLTAPVHDDREIEAAVVSLGSDQAGIILASDAFMAVHQQAVTAAAIRNNVPVIGADIPGFVKGGGLLSYGASFPDIFRRAVSYVDQILHGANPQDLPVEVPIKYQLLINLKTAKALGLTVPQSLLATADELIE